MKPELHIPYIFLEDCQGDDIKHVAFYLKLKGIYANSVIYNATKRSIIDKSKMSPYIVSKYLPLIIENGWARYQGNHLILQSFTKTFSKGKNLLHVNITQSFKQIIDNIRFSVVKKDYDTQMFMHDLKTHRLKTKRCLSYRAARSMFKKYMKSSYEESVEKCITSYRRIAEQCNVSLSSAHRIVKKWTEEGKIALNENIEYISPLKRREMIEFYKVRSGFVMKRGNYMIVHHGSFLSIAR